MKILLTCLLCTVPMTAFAHSGGTDSNGCHAGSEPYHCHNGEKSSAISMGAWDINSGYQYQFDKTSIIPYLGVSLGSSEHDGETSLGANLGVKHQNGLYAGYVSTSKSFQLGYDFFHLSINSDYLGVGIRYPFGNGNNTDQSGIYFSGSALFSGDE